MSIDNDVQLLRKPAVLAMTGLSESSLARARDFPAPVRLGPRQVAWVRAEVQAWIMRRLAARDAAVA